MEYWEEFEREVCALYIELGSMQATADQTGITPAKCREILKRRGYIDDSHLSPETLERYRAIAADFKSGAETQEIADAYSLPRAYVVHILKAQGIHVREETAERTAKRNKEILKAWSGGAPLKDLAEAYGLAMSTIANILSFQGIDWHVAYGLRPLYIPTGKPRGVPEGDRTKEIKQAIRNAAERDISLYEVAKAFAISKQYVYQLADQMGYHPSDPAIKARRRAPLDQRNSEIVADFKNGMSRRELAEKYGVSANTIGTIIKRLT